MAASNFPPGWHSFVRAHFRDTTGYVVAESGNCLAVQSAEALGPRTKVPGRKFEAIRPAMLGQLVLPKSWFMGVVLCPGDSLADVVAWMKTRSAAERDRVILYVHPKYDEDAAQRAWDASGLPPPRTTQFAGSWKDFHHTVRARFLVARVGGPRVENAWIQIAIRVCYLSLRSRSSAHRRWRIWISSRMPERAGHGHRDPDDYYATTVPLARLICAQIGRDFEIQEPRSILEPGCGAGTFLRAIRESWPTAAVHGIELHEELARFAQSQGFDVRVGNVLAEKLGDYDLILGNPPFRHSDAFIPILLDHLVIGGVLAFVLRLNYLAGQRRYDSIWRSSPPARIYALPARPGFTADGKTDATDYMVAAWRKGASDPCVMSWLDNRHATNKWRREDEFPDPRRISRPKRTHVSPGITLSEWPPKDSSQSVMRYDPRLSNARTPQSRST